MNIIDGLQQGTPEWHQFRASHFGASEAPAMLGESKHKTRTQLLREKATGIMPEVDAATQRRFDEGHRAEELARPLAEAIIGGDLYPVTGEEGKLSASFDGLTLDQSTAWEHKLLNDTLRACNTAADLPICYRIQMEQCLMLSGAARCLFSATKWDEAGNLIEKHIWYMPDNDLRRRILQGWTQFAIDIESYKHIEHAEKPKAEVCIELPALFIHAHGQITDSNMQAYGEALTAKLSEVRAIKLITDQDFSNAKEAAKLFREQCKKLELAKEAMLSQTVTIGEAARMMDAWHEDLRQTALKLEKDVEREDLAKKRVMVSEAGIAFSAHVEALESETRPIKLNVERPNFSAAIKGKRNYASMQDALDTALANAKIEADAIAKDVRAKLAWCKEHAAGMSFLFPDIQQIITKPIDDFMLTITSRIKDHNEAEARKEAEIRAKAEEDATAKLEAERTRIQAEEESKARAKAEAERAGAGMELSGVAADGCEGLVRVHHSAQPEPATQVEKSAEIVHIGQSKRPSDTDIIRSIIKENEIYAGAIINQNGEGHHIILLPGDHDEANHADSMEWAKSIGGDLPDRVELALLYKHLPDQFKKDWYWSGEQRAADSDYAWYQHFNNGYQGSSHNDNQLRARAVRYLAMDQAAPSSQTPFDTCPTCEALARTVMMDQTGAA